MMCDKFVIVLYKQINTCCGQIRDPFMHDMI